MAKSSSSTFPPLLGVCLCIVTRRLRTRSYNNVRALDEQALQYRGDSNIDIGGLYFSTFFGGSDSSWAPSSDMNAYFRNIQMWGSSSPSNLTGSQVSGAMPLRPSIQYSAGAAWGAAALALVGAVFGMLL